MNEITRPDRTPPPSKARSNRDWVMIVLGVALIALFVTAGYMGLNGPGHRPHKAQGPVKDPSHVGSVQDGGAPIGVHR